MTEPFGFDHLVALKNDLELLGCKVTITRSQSDQNMLTVNIIYPPDVPPPPSAPLVDDAGRRQENGGNGLESYPSPL